MILEKQSFVVNYKLKVVMSGFNSIRDTLNYILYGTPLITFYTGHP
jgi:hypothetical protein